MNDELRSSRLTVGQLRDLSVVWLGTKPQVHAKIGRQVQVSGDFERNDVFSVWRRRCSRRKRRSTS